MASRQLGPWKLKVKDRASPAFERYLATDGQRLAWVWRPSGQARGNVSSWEKLKAPWLPVASAPRGEGEPALLSDYVAGAPLADLFEALPEDEWLSPGAACAVALAVARGLEQVPEAIAGDEAPQVQPESILIGFEGTVWLMPWPDSLPALSEGPRLSWPNEYLTPEQANWQNPLPGWRAYAPSLVIDDAVEQLEALPLKARRLVERSLGHDPKQRPPLPELIDAIAPLASSAELAEALRRHLPHEPHEQDFARALAEGRDPEALPPELVASVAGDASDEAFNVLADWLLGEGRPRGELAALQLKLEQGASLELTRAEATLLSRHRSLLPIALRERLQQWRPIWKAGWLTGLELKAVPEAEVLTEILTHPTLRFLQRLRVTPEGGHSKEVADVLSSLELPALKRVELDGGMGTHAVRLKRAKPRLRVESNKDHQGFPTRRRPEASVTAAKVGVGEREPAPGLPPLKRLMEWLSGDD